jgi:hypothetical protein
MRELVTVASAFVIVVGLAIFMYSGNQKHTTAVMEAKELKEVVDKNHDELMLEINALKAHIAETDSIYHKRTNE